VPSPFTILNATSAATSGMGANLLASGAGASFRVWAPNATTVRVLLRADSSSSYVALPLGVDPTNAAYHSADVAGVAAGDEYRFSIDNDPTLGPDNPGGVFERIDPYARDVLSADAAAPALVSAVPKLATVSVQPSDFVIYQMHVGSIVGLDDGTAVVNRTATFQQAKAAIPRIALLGFTAVEFMPTSEDPVSPEGYAPSNYFAPEVAYGDPSDLRALVDECHRNHLAVILDVVYNHAIADDAFDRLIQFDGNTVNGGRGIYFSSFDNFGPVPDFDRLEVRSFFVDNVRQCFREYGADALRFDSAHAIRGRLRGPDVMADMLVRIKSDFPDKLLIAEHDNPAYAVNTLGFDACWQMGSADTFTDTVLAADLGKLEDLLANTLSLPSARARVAYLLGSHDQIFSDYEAAGGGTPTSEKAFNRYFVERVGGVIVGRDQPGARALARVGWLLAVAMPCSPMMFMGSECHHHGYWNPYLDAYGEHRFDNALLADAIGPPMVRFVTEANGLRATHGSMRGNGWLTTQRDLQNRVLAFKRYDQAGDVLLFVVNLGGTRFGGGYAVSLGGDGGSWVEVFNTQAPVYGGFDDSGNSGGSLDGSGGALTIRLPELSVLVFKKM
jgi:1,4-alpha-glucan branching enzyme